MKWIFLDSDPATLAAREVGKREPDDLRIWLFGQQGSSVRVVIPEIVDYEVRRELIRAKKTIGIRRLDQLYADEVVQFLPINSVAMKRAAELWAEARNQGHQTADDRAIDADVILVAQAMTHCSDAEDWMILTENVNHIARYVANRARSRRAIVDQWLRSSTSHMQD